MSDSGESLKPGNFIVIASYSLVNRSTHVIG